MNPHLETLNTNDLEEKLFGLLFSEARRLLEDASSHI